MSPGRTHRVPAIRTPDRRVRVFVSSTLGELAAERAVVRARVESLRMAPVMFEAGARPHPPRLLYRAYLEQSDVFIGIYWQRYGWVAPGESVSGLEDEYRLSDALPRLIYIKEPAPDREQQLAGLLAKVKSDDRSSYKRFADTDELGDLVTNDLAMLLADRFMADGGGARPRASSSSPPMPPTTTIGRADDIGRIAALVREGRRLVTLTGAGGVGKTRLAIEASSELRRDFPHGVHYVGLEAVTDAGLAAHVIADRLGAPVEGSRSALDAVLAVLSGPTLLILDNVEQIPDIGTLIAALLERAGGLHLLVTSRRALRVRGEHEWSVAPLRLAEARRLFVERARDVSVGFEPDDDDLGAIDELCRRVDGLPLALEIAASRCRLLTPRELLGRLDAHFDALGSGATDLPARQRTLRATVDWSYDLLTPVERALFMKLGVFVDGFTLASAESVCGDDDSAVADGLASLIDKSLVVSDGLDGEPRFRLLAVIASYARERLNEAGATPELRRRHLAWYRELAETAQPYLCGAGQREWAARFDSERADLRAAVETALDAGDDDAVIELTWDVIVFYFIRDAVYEPEGWLQRVADAGRQLDDVRAAKLRSLLTLMRIHRGEYDGAREPLASALVVFEARSMTFEYAVTLKELAWVRYLADDDAAAAVETLERASQLFTSIDHDWGVALTELQLGSVLVAEAELDRAARRVDRSLTYSTGIDNEPLMAQAHQQLGMIRVLEHDADGAVDQIAEATSLVLAGRHETEATFCLDVLAAVALMRGDLPMAATVSAAAIDTRDKLGVAPWPSLRAFVARTTAQTRDVVEFQPYAEEHDVFALLRYAVDHLSLG